MYALMRSTSGAVAALLLFSTSAASAWPTHFASDARKAAATAKATAAPAAANPPAAAPAAPAAGAAIGAAASAGGAEADDGAAAPAPFDKFSKGAETQSGLFTLLRKDGKVYFVLSKDQLDTDYYMHATTANGLGGFGILSGDDFEQPARIVRFERINAKQVAMVLPQTKFKAPPGSNIANAVKGSTADSTIAIAAVAAEDAGAGKIVIDPSYLLGDTLDLGNQLSDLVDNPKNPQGGYRLDSSRSFYETSKSFPENAVITVSQTFASSKPDMIDTVTDPHAITFHIKYNFAKILSSPDYMPRLADDRVGFWDIGGLDFSRDDKIDDMVRYATRWNLKASDPNRPSPAVKPIVYTLTNTIPPEYKPAIRDAILEWNHAFERIGILDAIKVEDQPGDPAWDADDIRYNPIRWLTEDNGGGFAEAQVEWDPRTGEIFRGGVLIDSDIMRYGKFYYTDVLGPNSGSPSSRVAASQTPELWNPASLDALLDRSTRHTFLHRDTGMAQQGAFVSLANELLGEETPPNYAYQFLKMIVLHEVGHDFGLAHNFIGHDAYSASQLRDKNFVAQNGVATSVMEYAPANYWPKGQSEAQYFQTVLGPYDYHVIHWGYARIAAATTPDQEVPTLNSWAQASNEPRYAFASDEDVEFNGHAVDPRIEQYMLTDDNVGWCSTQMSLDRKLINTLDNRFPRPQMPWDQERTAFGILMNGYARCAIAMSHYVGAEHLSRARRGDTHGPPPLTPVARTEEWRAFQSLNANLFDDRAWNVSSSTLRRLTYSEYEPLDNWGYNELPRHDMSLAGMVGAYQNRALAYMFSPLVLGRLADLPSKAGPYHPMTLADLFTWTQNGVYGDLIANHPRSTTLRHNLQRSYARVLERVAVDPSPGTPYDAQALARHELSWLDDVIHTDLRSKSLDLGTRAHLEALGVEVARTLDTRNVHSVDH